MSASKVTSGVPVPDGSREAAGGPFTHYPKHPTADEVNVVGGAWAPAAITAVDKRFTDAELAAEYWRRYFLYAEANGHQQTVRAKERVETLHRFATLPHYDEEPA